MSKITSYIGKARVIMKKSSYCFKSRFEIKKKTKQNQTIKATKINICVL